MTSNFDPLDFRWRSRLSKRLWRVDFTYGPADDRRAHVSAVKHDGKAFDLEVDSLLLLYDPE